MFFHTSERKEKFGATERCWTDSPALFYLAKQQNSWAAEMQTFSVRSKNKRAISDPLPFLEIKAELHILGPHFQLLSWASWEENWSACANSSQLSSTGLGTQAHSTASNSQLPFPLVQLEFFQIKELSMCSKGYYTMTKYISITWNLS